MNQLKAFANKYGFVAYPVLFAIFPLLSFYGANAAEIQSGDFSIATFLFFNLIVATIAWLASLLITRNVKTASILSVVFLAVFFTFGRLHNAIGDFAFKVPLATIGATKLLLIASIAVIAVSWFEIRKLPTKKVTKINSILLIVSTILVLSAFITIVPTIGHGGYPAMGSTKQAGITSKIAKEDLPDVYYILLDGYARADHLKSKFNYDNSEFINALKQKGFYVADKANTNYIHTHTSVPSTFNMKYLSYLTEEMGEESTDRAPLRELLHNNEVVRNFKNIGYKYVNIGSQWGWSSTNPLGDIDIKTAKDKEAKVLNIKLDEFALVYLQTTAIKPWVSANIKGTLLSTIMGAFERTEKVPQIKDPTFTFTHITSPHPPYLFDRNGPVKGQTELELLNDGFSNRKGYTDQTVYLNKLVNNLVDKIIKGSDKPPIIIVASDHGPASGLGRSDFAVTDVNKLNKEGIKERTAILNTFYFPDKNYSKLYPEITPVNSFRLIFSQYFGQDLKLLPDQSYFSNNKANEYRFIETTDIVN